MTIMCLGLVNQANTARSLFEYETGKSSADYETPVGYEPQYAGAENLSYEERLEIESICGEDRV